MRHGEEIRVISYIRREDGSEVELGSMSQDERARAARQLLLRFLGTAFQGKAQFAMEGEKDNG